MSEGSRRPQPDWRVFAAVCGGMLITLAAAFGFGLLFDAPPLARFEWSVVAALQGLAAAAPLVVALDWMMWSKDRRVVRFRESALDFFASIGFEFTPPRIAILSIGAGVSEELLFRGVLQSSAHAVMPSALAIILPCSPASSASISACSFC
jgi:hypothetical protein